MNKYGMPDYDTNDGGESPKRPDKINTDEGEPRLGPMPEWVLYITVLLFGFLIGGIAMTLKYNP